MSRYSIQDTWEQATECVSDLEDCQRELRDLLKCANVKSIPGIQKAVEHIEQAVDVLMNQVPNGG